MRVLVKVLILVAIVAIAAYLFSTYGGDIGETAGTNAERTKPPVPVEEKYGYTTETVP